MHQRLLDAERGIIALREIVAHAPVGDEPLEQDRRNNAIEWIAEKLAVDLSIIGSYAEQEARGVQGDLS